MKWKMGAVLFAISAALVLMLYKAFGTDPHAVPFMMEGKPAPTFRLKRLGSQETLSLAQLKGRPFVLNFWATWCGPCEEEQPILDWGAQTFKDRVEFFGVLFEDTEENTKGWFTTPPVYAQLIDPKSQVAVDYGVAGVPETYFVDAEGNIRNKFVGPIDQQTLASRINALTRPAATAEARP